MGATGKDDLTQEITVKDVRGGIFDVESGLIYKMFKMCVDIFDTSNYLVAFL